MRPHIHTYITLYYKKFSHNGKFNNLIKNHVQMSFSSLDTRVYSSKYLSTVSARLTSLTWRNLLVYVYLSRWREGQVFRCLKTTLKILSPLTRPRLQTSDRGIAACICNTQTKWTDKLQYLFQWDKNNRAL